MILQKGAILLWSICECVLKYFQRGIQLILVPMIRVPEGYREFFSRIIVKPAEAVVELAKILMNTDLPCERSSSLPRRNIIFPDCGPLGRLYEAVDSIAGTGSNGFLEEELCDFVDLGLGKCHYGDHLVVDAYGHRFVSQSRGKLRHDFVQSLDCGAWSEGYVDLYGHPRSHLGARQLGCF